MTKYPINKALYIAGILVMFSSCITIRINSNGYKDLTTQQLDELRQYGESRSANNPNYLVEITAKDLQQSFKENEYTWVHFWAPYCGNNLGDPITNYDSMANAYRSNGLELFIVANDYDYDDVTKQVKGLDRDIYVLKTAQYGHKTGKNTKNFIRELKSNGDIDEVIFAIDLLFKKDSLIYHRSITAPILDSIINATQ